MTPVIYFLSGVLVLGYLVASLFFLRFWRQSADRLFAWFSAAFFLLAAQRMMVVMLQPHDEVAYVVRLLAFVLILVAIWEKNRKSER